MSERAGIFDDGSDFDVGGFAPQKPKESAPREKVRQVSEAASFKSREPEPKKTANREARVYRTGRNAQFNIKADPQVIDTFYAIAAAQGWVLGETLERAVKALEAELSGKK
jgi:hypothetical protein